jgi:hypothetical protein
MEKDGGGKKRRGTTVRERETIISHLDRDRASARANGRRMNEEAGTRLLVGVEAMAGHTCGDEGHRRTPREGESEEEKRKQKNGYEYTLFEDVRVNG